MSTSSRPSWRSWRYLLDADAAAGRELTVGLDFIDSGERVTVRPRHSILVVDDDLDGDSDVTTTGDSHAWTTLTGLLDRDVVGFHMHRR